jgi:hypothetical protein
VRSSRRQRLAAGPDGGTIRGRRSAMANEIPPEVRATHTSLSAAAARFLDYVAENPDCARKLDYRQAPGQADWLRGYLYPLQTWPTFVGAAKLEEVQAATVGVTRLIRSIPERLFDNDPRRISQYYGIGDETLTALLLEPPNGTAEALARCDFIDSTSGFRCVEANMGATIGGWQHRFWERQCRLSPPIARFLREAGIDPVYRDPFQFLFQYIAEDVVARGIAAPGKCNVALPVMASSFQRAHKATVHLNEMYSSLLRDLDPGLGGEVVVCLYPELTTQRGRVYFKQTPIHAVVEYTDTPTPHDVYRCFKAEAVGLYSGPLAKMLGDKRNLALLSQHEDGERFSAGEKAIIRDHLPWCREVRAGETTWRGETISLLDFLRERRQEMVIKVGLGSRGEGVHVGRFTADEEWRHRVQTAAHEGGWLVQEYLGSRPYLYQSGDDGYGPHDVVWGLFCFGRHYGGGFLRMMPRGAGDGIINSAHGATEGFIFEV